jgi:predicted RNA-binding Zn ribbon-like protein
MSRGVNPGEIRCANRLKPYHPVMIPEVPDGPLTSGAPYWYWLGGRPAVDFVNTLRERWRRNVECLASAGDLSAWLTAARLLPTATPADADLLEGARSLREAIDAGLRAVVAGEPAPHEALAEIDGWLAAAPTRPTLTTGQDGQPLLAPTAPDTPRRALGLVALDAAEALGRPEQRCRLRICASETCSARFYDRSPGGRRRWCSMAGCGNVAKARRHRARQVAP